jgi:recombination protein RecR
MITPLEDLINALTTLPTIGKKSAWRLALFLIEQKEEDVNHLAQCIYDLKTKIQLCKQCFNYSESELCPICQSDTRDKSIICIVEKPLDIYIIEQSRNYDGLFHVIGGVLSPINGVTSDKLRIAELEKRVEIEKPRELIIGLSGNEDAETTSLFITRIFNNTNIRITRFARGLPVGIELEYIDQITLNQALNNRTSVIKNKETE